MCVRAEDGRLQIKLDMDGILACQTILGITSGTDYICQNMVLTLPCTFCDQKREYNKCKKKKKRKAGKKMYNFDLMNQHLVSMVITILYIFTV